jgi:Domain of unknown function (DUF955).
VSHVDALMQHAYDHDIFVYQHALAGVNAIAFQSQGEYVIAIDTKSIVTEAEQAVILAHELGHIERGALYNNLTPYETIDRCEHKAWTATIERLAPVRKLKAAIRSCGGRLWEVAEDLGVTEDLINRAIAHYRTKGIDI